MSVSTRSAVLLDAVSRRFRVGRDVRIGLPPTSLDVGRGAVAALTGPNGCGKTTTLRIIATLILPSGGVASVCGFDCVREPLRVRRLLGVSLGGARSFYWRLTAAHNLSFSATLLGVAPVRVRTHIRELAEELGLGRWLATRAVGLSRGTLARLAVARALLGSPDVVLLDEPFAGIDAQGRELVWDALRWRVAAGMTVVLATHDPTTIARCDLVRPIPA